MKQINSLSKTLMNDYNSKGSAFLPYVVLGYPSWEVSFDLVCSLFDLGASSIELGMPFTDPVADGIILQTIFKKTLQLNLFSIEKMFLFLEKVSTIYPEKEFILMGYLNIFYKNGWFQDHFKYLHKYNVFNVLIPDLPLEEELYLTKKYVFSHTKQSTNFIHFLTPNTSQARFTYLLEHSAGFLYLLSYRGVTGEQNSSFQLPYYSKQMQKACHEQQIPTLVGFGVSTKKHVEEIKQTANGFIIGSFIYKIVQKYLNTPGQITKHVSKSLQNILK